MRSKARTRLREYYDSAAPTYLDKMSRGLCGWLRRRELALTDAMIPEVAGGKALDAGCGPGYYCQVLRDRGHDVTAVDISPEMVGIVRDLGFPAYVMDIEHSKPPPELPAPFDFILCAGVLEFAENVQRFLRSLRNLAVDGGEMLLIAPTSGLFGSFYSRYLKSIGIPARVYSRKPVVEDLRAVGFEPLEVRYAWPMCLAVRAKAV